jgi:hypothetical protein
VEHRHVDQHTIGTTATHFAVHRVDHPAQFALAENAALRSAGSSAGKYQAGDVVGARNELGLAPAATIDESLVASHAHRRLAADGHE